jgi:hypothetical protein
VLTSENRNAPQRARTSRLRSVTQKRPVLNQADVDNSSRPVRGASVTLIEHARSRRVLTRLSKSFVKKLCRHWVNTRRDIFPLRCDGLQQSARMSSQRSVVGVGWPICYRGLIAPLFTRGFRIDTEYLLPPTTPSHPQSIAPGDNDTTHPTSRDDGAHP